MRRATLILLAALVSLFALASPAAASNLALSPWTQFAVNDSGAYWVKGSPKGCKACNQLWRMSLADGTSVPVGKPMSGSISDLSATGTFVGFTLTKKSLGSYATSVWMLSPAGELVEVAHGNYDKRRKSRCGSLVGAGRISSTGELSWIRIDVPKSEGNCEWLASYVFWSAYATTASGVQRQLISPLKSGSELLAYDEALESVRPIEDFNGTQLLIGLDSGPLQLNDISTGAITRYQAAGYEEFAASGVLSPTGSVVTAFHSAKSNRWSIALFGSPSDGKTFTDVSVPGAAGYSSKFCAGELFQLIQFSRTVAVLHRDSLGNILSSKTFTLGKHLELADLQCNARTGVITYEKTGRNGHILAGRSFSFELY